MAVKKLKDGRWAVYYRNDGKLKWEYFGRGPEAEEKARLRNQALGFGPKASAGEPLFEDVAKAYLRHKRAQGQMNENSLAALKLRLSVNILPELGPKVATALNDADLDRYIERRKTAVRYRGKDKRGRPKVAQVGVKVATINRELTDIKAIMNFGANRKPPLIPFNPVAHYKKPGDVDLDIIQPPTMAEVDRIMAEAPEHLRRAIRLSWFLGLRPGAVELFGLTWSDVSWATRTIRIRAAQKGAASRRREMVRQIPVLPAFLDEMRTWFEADRRKIELAIIRYRNKPVKNIHRAWWGAVERARIGRRIRLYDLRHAFVTRAIEAGADLKALSEIAGSDPRTLIKHYQHVTTAKHRQAVEAIPFWVPSPAKKKGAEKKKGEGRAKRK